MDLKKKLRPGKILLVLLGAAVIGGAITAVPVVIAARARLIKELPGQFDEYFAGPITTGPIGMVLDPPAVRTVGSHMVFPVTSEFEIVIWDSSMQVGMGPISLFRLATEIGWPPVMDTSISDAKILIRKREKPERIPHGIFADVPSTRKKFWSFTTDIVDSDLHFFTFPATEKFIEGIRLPMLRITKCRITTVNAHNKIEGEGLMSLEKGQLVNVPVKYTLEQDRTNKKMFHFWFEMEAGTFQGQWYFSEEPAWVTKFEIRDAKKFCLLMVRDPKCGTWDYKTKMRGTVVSDAKWKVHKFDSWFEFRQPVLNKPIREVVFSGNAKGTYFWDTTSIKFESLDAQGPLGKIHYVGDWLMLENRYVANVDFSTDDFNVWNTLLEGFGLPPGGATFKGEFDIPFDRINDWQLAGDFRFEGYRLTQVDQARSFMRFLKITEDGADEDELIFPESQGIGLEIRKGSGGKLKMRGGKLYTPDFSIHTETMNVKLIGYVDFISDQYDCYLKFQGLKQVDRMLTYIPLLGRLWDKPENSILDLNFRIVGPLKSPLFKPVYSIPDVPPL